MPRQCFLIGNGRSSYFIRMVEIADVVLSMVIGIVVN